MIHVYSCLYSIDLYTILNYTSTYTHTIIHKGKCIYSDVSTLHFCTNCTKNCTNFTHLPTGSFGIKPVNSHQESAGTLTICSLCPSRRMQTL